MRFQDRVEAWMRRQENDLTREHQRWKRYPKTITMVLLLAIVLALFAATAWQAVFPPAPSPPVEKVTVAQAWDMLFAVQLPAVWWGVIFLFLWMTKW